MAAAASQRPVSKSFAAEIILGSITVSGEQLATKLWPISASERQLMKKLQLLRFRPKMIDGIPQGVNGSLKYMLASRSEQ